MSKPTEAEHVAQLLSHFDGRLTELVSLMRGTVANQTLFSGTVKLDAAGVWTASWEVPYAAVMVGSSCAVTIDSSGTKDPAPLEGIGVHKTSAGCPGHWRVTGRELTLYGTPGARVSVIVTTDAPDHLIGAPAGTTTVPIGAGTTVLSATPGSITGFAFRETAGAVARVTLFDGADNAGALMIPISLVANESTRAFPGRALSFSKLAAVVISGAVEGAVFLS